MNTKITPETSEQKRLRIVAEIHRKNTQDLILFENALAKIMRQRSAEAMKETARKAMVKAGYL